MCIILEKYSILARVICSPEYALSRVSDIIPRPMVVRSRLMRGLCPVEVTYEYEGEKLQHYRVTMRLSVCGTREREKRYV